MPNHVKKGSQLNPTKLCPYCLTHNKVDAEICINAFSCGKKIGKVDENGFAKKPTDWWSYINCSLWCFLFLFYLWMLGWSKPLLNRMQLIATWVWDVVYKVLLIWRDWLFRFWDWLCDSPSRLWDWLSTFM